MSSFMVSLESTLDDITRIIDKIDWISSYEVFLQSIELMTGKVTKNFELRKKERNGVALRIISKRKKLVELSLGNSRLSLLTSLSEPKSTTREVPIFKFQKLKSPRISSIQGDQANSTNITIDLISNMLTNAVIHNNKDNIDLTHHIKFEKEKLMIINTGSRLLKSVSFRFRYTVSAKIIHNTRHYSTIRYKAGRNSDVNFSQVIDDAKFAVKRQSQKRFALNTNDVSVIIHPEVLGRIIAFHSANHFVRSPSRDDNEIIWDENIHIYDDPHRIGGYGSSLFDDEGSLTKPRKIMERGIHTGGLFGLSNSNWKIGGNGFRTSWYHPFLRSYQFPVIRNITNLVVTGGIGKGERFVERSGLTLVILRGHGYASGSLNSPQFIVHTSETEVWKNGEFKGIPAKNMTIRGSINQVMKYGDLSADQYSVVDIAVPGAIYIGYIYVPTGITTLS